MKECHDFRFDLEFSKESQSEAAKLFGKDNLKVEIKDESRKWKETGNVFIEIQSRGKPSGLTTSLADVYHIKLRDGLAITISKELLKELIVKIPDNAKILTEGGDNDSSMGYLIKITRLINGAREC